MENSDILLKIYAPGGACGTCCITPLFFFLHQSQNQINEPTFGFRRIRERKAQIQWERESQRKKKCSEERESQYGLSLLNCRKLSNTIAHHWHHQDRCVRIYNISLSHRRPIPGTSPMRLRLKFKYAIFGLRSSALRFAKQPLFFGTGGLQSSILHRSDNQTRPDQCPCAARVARISGSIYS